jgi:hypothetical protein
VETGPGAPPAGSESGVVGDSLGTHECSLSGTLNGYPYVRNKPKAGPPISSVKSVSIQLRGRVLIAMTVRTKARALQRTVTGTDTDGPTEEGWTACPGTG